MDDKSEEINLLNQKVGKIFQLAGFKVSHNIILEDCNVRLLAVIDLPNVREDFKVACDFQYEDSEVPARELIMSWIDKNKKLRADKVIIALCGIELYGEDREMAEEHGILIWEESDVADYLNHIQRDREDGTKRIMAELDLDSYQDPDANYIPAGRGDH